MYGNEAEDKEYKLYGDEHRKMHTFIKYGGESGRGRGELGYVQRKGRRATETAIHI